MKKQGHKLLALLLAMALLLGLLPGAALAAEESATIVFSFSYDGDFVVRPTTLTVSAGEAAQYGIGEANSFPTVLDAVAAAHKQIYGAAFTADTASNYMNSQMQATLFGCGNANTYFGHYINGEYGDQFASEQSITDEDIVAVFDYSDNYSNAGFAKFLADSQFVSEISTSNGSVSLQLVSDDKPLSGVEIGVMNEDGTLSPNNLTATATTQADGTFTLHFTQNGTFYIMCHDFCGDMELYPAWCKVTVTGAISPDDISEYIRDDKAALTIGGLDSENNTVTNQLLLPSVGESGKTSIVWSSSNTEVISDNGRVVKGVDAATVTLTATITCGAYSDTRSFVVNVPAATDSELVHSAKAALEEAAPISPSQWNEDYTAAGDTNIVPVVQRLVDKAVAGITVGNTVISTNETCISSDGTITYPRSAKTFDVTFTLSRNEISENATVSVLVPRETETRQSIMDQSAEALAEGILGDNSSADNITSDLNFTQFSSVLDFYVKVDWTSSIPEAGKDYLDRYGSVTRPAYGKPDATFTLSPTLSWYTTMEEYMPSGYVGPIPEDKILSYPLTIKAYTEAEYQSGKTAVDTALAEFDVNSITYFSDKTVADLGAVTGSLMLPSVDGFSTSTVWSSGCPSVIEAPSYKTGRAVVHRPEIGTADATCTLTLTLTQNGYTNSRDIPVTVKALTQTEIDAANKNVKQVADALTFQVIKGKNTLASGVTEQLDLWKSATLNGTEIIWSKSSNALTGYRIEWTSSPQDIVDGYGNLTRPHSNTAVTLTAQVSSADDAYASPVTVHIPITVLADGVQNLLSTLLENISSSYVNSGFDPWIMMDMSAYADYAPDTAHKTSPAARQSYLNSAIEALSSSGCSDQTYAKEILALTSIGADPARLYPVNSNTSFSAVAGLNSVSHSTSVWSAPYTLAAYNQGDFQSERYETALVDALLDNQQADGSWKEFGTIDTTANAIAGLSFYAGDPAVDAAIQKAVTYLSGEQLEDGTFDEGDSGWPTVSNANSTAMVIVALAAVGINPADDARFVKNGYSVLDGLLSFALDDLSGFGRSDGSTLNASATEQGFRALVAAAQVISSGSAYQIYDFSAHELAPGRATGSGSPVTPSDPDTTSTITVTFSMKADTGYWISPKSVTVKEGSTVYHAFVEALKGTGITAVGAADGYVTSITNNGKTLGEFSNGKDSGWLYKVNGELPDISLTEYGISDGDVIVWYYTNDWTQDPSAGSFSGSSGSSSAESTTVIEPKSAVNGTSAKASVTEKEMTAAIEAVLEEESDSITIAPSGAEDAVQVSITLPVSSVKQMADETSAALVLETESGSVSLSHAALSSAAGQAKGNSLVITVERLTVKDAAHLADAVIPEQSVIAAVSVSSGGVKLTSFGGEKLTVSIPVGREPYENGKTYKVLVVGDDGAVESTSGKCVKSGGKLYVQVTATHLSTFIVTPQTIETPPFTDIEGHWAYDAITYVYQSGLMKGISADKFAPAGTVDRATLVTILYRLEGEPAVTSPVPFTDVTANAWYADAVVWASEAGIVHGVGEDRFAPSSNITREQLAAMLCRYASYQGYNISGTWDLSGYSDFDLISAWAAEAVGWANQQGLLTGKTTSILDPGGTASRAEAAAVLMRYIDYLAG